MITFCQKLDRQTGQADIPTGLVAPTKRRKENGCGATEILGTLHFGRQNRGNSQTTLVLVRTVLKSTIHFNRVDGTMLTVRKRKSLFAVREFAKILGLWKVTHHLQEETTKNHMEPKQKMK